MKYFLSLINLIVSVAIGVIYVELIKFAMSEYISFFGDAYTTTSKVLTTGLSTLFAVTVVFASNWLITHQKPMWVACSCSLMSLIYFYQVNPGGNMLTNVVINLFYVHSALAFLFFTVIPLAVAATINKVRQEKPA